MRRMSKWLVWLMIVTILLPSNWSGTGIVRANDGGVALVDRSNDTESADGSVGLMSTSQIIYVKENGNGNGESWADAFGTLDEALDAAVQTDGSTYEIWMAEGTYVPMKGSSGIFAYRMKNNVTIYGGFPKEGSPGWSERNWQEHITILSGDVNRNDDPMDPSTLTDNRPHVFFHSSSLNLDETAVLDGVTISGGRAVAAGTGANAIGGGIYNDKGHITLRNVIFRDNNANYQGGGLYNNTGNLSMSNVLFIHNVSSEGAGIYNVNGKLELTDFVAQHNSSDAIRNMAGEVELVDGEISHNASVKGAGIYNDIGGLIVKDTIISTNGGAHSAHGIQSRGAMSLERVTISDNKGTGVMSRNGIRGTPIKVTLSDTNIARNLGGGINISSGDTEFPMNATIIGGTISDNGTVNSNGQASPIYGGGISVGGNITITGTHISGNVARDGAGVYNRGKNTLLDGVTIKGNETVNTLYSQYGYGGGVYTTGSNASMTVKNSTITENSSRRGGGLYQNLGNLIVEDGDISENNASGHGGGMYVYRGNLTVKDSNLNGNVAEAPSGTGYVAGGGIHVENALPPNPLTNLILSNVSIENNYMVGGNGGGLSVQGGVATLTDVRVFGNKADGGLTGQGMGWGGGVYVWLLDERSSFTNVMISGNDARRSFYRLESGSTGYGGLGQGGGIYVRESNHRMENVLITGNVATSENDSDNQVTYGSGGGIYNDKSSPTIVNATISGNYSKRHGAGITNATNTSTPEIYNSIIWGNHSDTDFNAIYNYQNAVPVIDYSIVEGINDSGSNDSNLNMDPLFVQPVYLAGDSPVNDGNYDLVEGSPAIDRGFNDWLSVDLSVDLKGTNRIVGGIVDIGAYEYSSDLDAPEWPVDAALIVEPHSATSVSLSWTKAEDNIAVAGYKLYRDNIEIVEFPPHIFEGIDLFTYTEEGLIANTTYRFKVTAFDENGNENTGLVVEYSPNERDEQNPEWASESYLKAVGSGQQIIQIEWSAATDNQGIEFYEIYVDGTLYQKIDGSIQRPTYSTEITGLTANTMYTIRVEAIDFAGNRAIGPEADVKTAETPTNPTLQPLFLRMLTGSQVQLTWEGLAEQHESSTYHILRGATEDQLTVIDTVVDPIESIYVDNQVNAATMYYYAIEKVEGTELVRFTETSSIVTPELEDIQVQWSIPRSAYPYMMALQGEPLHIVVTGDAGRTVEATVQLESWFDTNNGRLMDPREITLPVVLVEDTNILGRYTASVLLPEGTGNIVSISAMLSDGLNQVAANVPVDLLVTAMIDFSLDQEGNVGNLRGSRLVLWNDEAAFGSTTIILDQEITYPLTGIIPYESYTLNLLEYQTNRNIYAMGEKVLLPGERLHVSAAMKASASLMMDVRFNGATINVPLGLRITVTDVLTGQIVSSQLTNSSSNMIRLGSGIPFLSEQKIKVQLSGIERPYVGTVEWEGTLSAGTNTVQLEVKLAEAVTVQGSVYHARSNEPLPGMQVTAVQVDPNVTHRSFVSKTLTDGEGKYVLRIYPEDATIQVVDAVSGLTLGQTDELQRVGDHLVDGATVTRNYTIEPTPIPVKVKTRITTEYLSALGQAGQTWEPDEIDWRIATHFYMAATGPDGRRASGSYPYEVYGNVGEQVNVCVNGEQADLPKSCGTAEIVMKDGKLEALVEINLKQTGAVVEGRVLNPSGDEINNWTGRLFKLEENGKKKAVYGSQHGINNRTRSSNMRLWLPEPGDYELQMSSGTGENTLKLVREITVSEGEVRDLGTLILGKMDGSFSSSKGNQLHIIESELLQGGELTIRAVYQNDGKDAVTNAQIKVVLPDGMVYVPNSAVLNNEVANASDIDINVSSVGFNIGNIESGASGVVRFKIRADALASLSDEVGTTAMIHYKLHGSSITELLGAAQVPVVQVTITAPSFTASKQITIFGSAAPLSHVDVYSGQILLGRSIASPAGTWSMEIELPGGEQRELYSLQATALTDEDERLHSDVTWIAYHPEYPHLTNISMAQRDGRKVTIDPRHGIAYFPYVFISNSPFKYELTFSDPTMVSNVWVRMGHGSTLIEAQAVLEADGIFRAEVPPNMYGPVYVDYDIDIEQSSALENDWLDHVLLPAGFELAVGTTPARLTAEEETLLEEATFQEVVVQGETFHWGYAQLDNEVDLSEELIDNLIEVNIDGNVYYTDGLMVSDDQLIFSLYGENLSDLNLIGGQEPLSLLSMVIVQQQQKPNMLNISSSKIKYLKGFWKITKDTSGPIKSVTVDNPAFDNAVNALNEMISEAALICDPILRVDAQRTLRGIRDRDVIDYELKVNVVGAPLNLLGGIIIDNVKTAVYAEQIKLARKLLDAWLSRNNCGGGKPKGTITMQPKFIYDPSGFVYEAVESNRIEGVQATLLYQDPAAKNEWVVWDAEWYLQKNPHWTDVNGRYGWDVPEGNWQVIYEKDGYETAYSKDHYAPHPIVVLPPHFDVNIPMISYQAPEVLTVESKSDGKHIDVTFSRYMQLNMFGEATVLVETVCLAGQTTCTREPIPGTWTGLDTDDDRDLARTIRFMPDAVMSVGQTISITIDSIVQSYAGVPMDEAFIADVFIEEMPEVEIPGPENPGPENPDPENPGTENPGPTKPGTPSHPVDEGETVTDDGYPIDPTLDQTIVVNNGELVIDIPAGTISVDLQNVRIHVEQVERTKYLPPSGYQSFIPTFLIKVTGEDETGKKVSIEQFLKPVRVAIQLDSTPMESAHPMKIAAFISEQGKWIYLDGAFQQERYTYVLFLQHPGVIAVLLTNKTFPDIVGHWAQEIIEVMSGRGIVEGRNHNNFDPNASITRAEYVALLTRVLHLRPLPEEKSSFTDVVEGKWYHGVIAAAYSEQLVGGISETRFGPSLNITREQIAVMLQRAYANVLMSQGKQLSSVGDSTLASYADGDQVSDWALDGMSFAIKYGIIQGRGKDTIAPKAMASRAEAVVMLQRFMDLIWSEMNK